MTCVFIVATIARARDPAHPYGYGISEAKLCGAPDEVDPRPYAELAVGVGEMKLDRPL